MDTLYRKYRPIDFDTVVGQDAIVKTLRNQIINGSTTHAYLFSGTRGTGKTTVAKIFARAMNCPNEINGNPCNECQTCKTAIEGRNLNIMEVDAASTRGIEGIRRIIEDIEYIPRDGEKKKVYIIDEAHALTGDAAQALLKSLEEPPEHVVFILATTDPNKLPETILSRCQRFNFKRINIEAIVNYLKKICDLEKIDIDEDALVFIAEKSDGSMRESISKLDRVRAYSINEKLDKKRILDILGIVDDEDFSVFVKSVNEGKVKEAFSILNDSLDKGKDINQFASDLIWHLRNLLIVKDLKEPVETLNITKNNFDILKKESDFIAKDVIVYFIEELSKTLRVMRYDENRRVILETTIIRLATPEMTFVDSAILARLSKIEEIQKKGTFVTMPATEEIKEDAKEVKEGVKEDKTPKKIDVIEIPVTTAEDIKTIIDNWNTISSSLGIRSKAIIEKSKPIPEIEGDYIEVQVSKSELEFLSTLVELGKVEEDLTNITRTIMNKDIKYRLISTEDSKYSEKVVFKFDNAKAKIGMEVGKVDAK